MDDSPHLYFANTMLGTEILLRNPACRVSASDYLYLLVCQHRAAVAFSIAFPTATLAITVCVILNLRAQKQMLRIDARRIIAVMQNVRAIWDRAVMQLPRDPVRAQRINFSALRAAGKNSITVLITASRPNPTPCWRAPVNLLPKP